jgi:hypothetical protein
MEPNGTTSTSLSHNNFYAEVAPEVDTGTSNPDRGFSSSSSVPPEKNSAIIPQIMLRPPSETRIMKDTRPNRDRKLNSNNNISNRFETNYVDKDYSNINFDKWLENCFKLLLWFRNISQYDIKDYSNINFDKLLVNTVLNYFCGSGT